MPTRSVDSGAGQETHHRLRLIYTVPPLRLAPSARGRHSAQMISTADLPAAAADAMATVLAPDAQRRRHSTAVARTARAVATGLPAHDRQALVAAAYLHDIGRSPAIEVTGHHGLDGALHLQDDFPARVVALVAHHSEARWEAELRGLAAELAVFPREQSLVADALTYADMTTGPAGERMSLEARVAEIMRRYGAGHLLSRAVDLALPHLEAAVDRVQGELLGGAGAENAHRSAAASPPLR